MKLIIEVRADLGQVDRESAGLSDRKKLLMAELHDIRMAELGLIPEVTILSANGKEYLFVRIDSFLDLERPWLRGRQKLKNGSWSERTSLVFSYWEIKAQAA